MVAAALQLPIPIRNLATRSWRHELLSPQQRAAMIETIDDLQFPNGDADDLTHKSDLELCATLAWELTLSAAPIYEP